MKPALLCLAAAALFGAATPASKALLNDSGPLMLAGLLYLGAALGVLPFSLRGGSPDRWRDRRNVRRLAGATLFGGVVGPIAILMGLSLAPSASVALWLNLEGVATAFVAWAFFREHIGGRVWLATLVMLVACVALASPGSFSLAPAAGLVLLGCVAWALDNNLTAVIDGFTPAQSTLVKGLVAAVVNLGLAVLAGQSLPPIGVAVAAMALGAVSYGISIMLYISGAQHMGATRSQVLFSTAPFIGVALSWWALSEPIQGAQLLAGALIAVALGLMIRSGHRHEHRHQRARHTHLHTHDDGHHDHSHPGLPAGVWHTHEHQHTPTVHTHEHQPDLHHRHTH